MTKQWSIQEIEELKQIYANAKTDEDINLSGLEQKFGRLKSNISRKARSFGLTNKSRIGKSFENRKSGKRKFQTDEELKQAVSERIKTYIKTHGHPKGMRGKKHTDEVKKIISQKSYEMNKSFSQEQKIQFVKKGLQTKIKNGTYANHRPNTTWKSGWRQIGGISKYYRSRWEANYARYLEWLKINQEIKSWEHEPQTFWFEGIKRGSVSYLPDFKVTENDGSESFHEVKGWMDSRSKTKLARMKKYFPYVKIVLIKERQYKEIERKLGKMIAGWESE